MNDAKSLALLAHKAMVDEIAELQQRMALRRMIQEMHGDKALPVRDFYRHTLTRHQQVLSKAPELFDREDKADRERLAVLYGLIEPLEEQFARFHEADEKAWMDGLAAYFRDQRR